MCVAAGSSSQHGVDRSDCDFMDCFRSDCSKSGWFEVPQVRLFKVRVVRSVKVKILISQPGLGCLGVLGVLLFYFRVIRKTRGPIVLSWGAAASPLDRWWSAAFWYLDTDRRLGLEGATSPCCF